MNLCLTRPSLGLKKNFSPRSFFSEVRSFILLIFPSSTKMRLFLNFSRIHTRVTCFGEEKKNWNEKSLFVRCEKCRRETFRTILCFVVCNKCLQTNHLQSCLSTCRPKRPLKALLLLMMLSKFSRRPKNIFSSVNSRSTEVSDIMNQHELKGSESLILFKDTDKRAILLLYYYFWYSQRHWRWERRRRRKHFLTANSSIKTKTFSRKIFSRFSDALQDGTKRRKTELLGIVKDNSKHLKFYF